MYIPDSRSARYQAPVISILLLSMQMLTFQAAAEQAANIGPSKQESDSLKSISSFKSHNLISLNSTGYKIVSSKSSSEESDFVNSVSGFYSTLSARQELLGREFENLLVDNLWDLYLD